MAARIINVGIATVDAIARTIEHLPGPGGLELFDGLEFTTGGCAVNCAIDLAKMGLSNSLIVKLGSDMLGDFVLSEAARRGIDTSRCLRQDRRNTAFTFVMVDPTGERRFFHTLGTNATLGANEIDVDFVAQHQFCYIGGIMIMPALDGEPLVGVLKELRRRNVVTVLDTVYVDQPDRWKQVIFPLLPHLDYFVPSEPEARAITDLSDAEQIDRALKDHGAGNVVIKRGEKGVYYSTRSGENSHVPAYRVEHVVDTTGAGDAWDAGFLAGLSSDLAIEDACRLGNAVAAFCIQAAGASTGVTSLEEIKAFQRQNS